MQRITEPELMDEAEQARAYAMADFAEPNERFVGYFETEFPDLKTGSVLDLGCGPGDIVLRLATRRTGLTVHGIDGSAAMLRFASESLHESPELGGRVQFIEGLLPGATLPLPAYDQVCKASHSFNLLDARRAISVTERQRYILRVRKLSQAVAEAYFAQREKLGFPGLKKARQAAAA